MNQAKLQDCWAESNSGLRGSTLMRIGGLLTIVAPLGKSSAEMLSQKTDLAHLLMTASWVSWILALLVLAAAFIWVGAKPFLGRFGLYVGIFHLLNSVFLMVVLFANVNPPVPSISLSIGRNLLLVFFVLLERRNMGKPAGKFLISMALLQIVKMGTRLLDLTPTLVKQASSGLDSLFLILLGLSLVLLGNEIKKSENIWARQLLATRASGLAAFNNPEHPKSRDVE